MRRAGLWRPGLGRVLAGLIALGLIVLPVSSASAAKPAATVDRIITDPRITESSGLITSLLHPGVLWTHNDSGNPPLIYAISKHGSTLATLRLGAEPDIDWEAIAGFRGPAGGIAAGRPLIAIGDIGDNDAVRPSVRVAILTEPAQLRTASVSPIRVLRLRYPDGPRDAETLLSDPRTGQLFIVSKTLFGATLYAVPLSVWPGGGGGTSRLTTLTRVASMSAGFITDGAFLPDGRIVLRGYDRVSIIEAPDTVHDGRLSTLASAMLPGQDQGESIALIDGGRQALIGSEGKREPVLRITLPMVPGDNPAGTPPVTLPAQQPADSAAGSTPAGPAAAGTVAGNPRAFAGVGALKVWAGVIGGGLVVLLLTSAGVLLWTRRDS